MRKTQGRSFAHLGTGVVYGRDFCRRPQNTRLHNSKNPERHALFGSLNKTIHPKSTQSAEPRSSMSTNPPMFRAGAASAPITPDEPLWLAGYAVRTGPPRGKITELYASAPTVEDQTGQRLVIASIENLSIPPAITEPVARSLQARHGLARHELLLAATHTHYAPEHRSGMQPFYRIPEEYVAKMPAIIEALVAGLTNAIDGALARVEPVRLFATKTSADFAHNRRRLGVVAGNPSPDDTIDHDVPVLWCTDSAGQCKAIVFGYACHQTTIPPEDSRYCGDWAGFAKQHLEQANPAATSLFVPGAGADQDPEPRAALDLSQKYGKQLADAIQLAIDFCGSEITGPIRIAWEDVPLKLNDVTDESIQQMLNSNDPPQHVKARALQAERDRGAPFMSSYPAPLQVVRLGSELLIIALSGEPVVDWAHKFKAKYERTDAHHEHGEAPSLRYPIVWVAGYSNDVFDYLPTRRIQLEGGYEAGRANLWNPIPAPFTEALEDRLTQAVEKLVAKVSST